MMHHLQRYGTVNSKRHPRNLILGCLFVSSSFHSVPSSALCFAKSQEVDPSRSRRNLIVSLMLGSLGQIDLIVIKGGQPFTRDLRQGGMIRFEPQGKKISTSGRMSLVN